MSITASSPIQIHDSPLNTSSSKQLYSFSKNPRFNNDIHINCASAFYDMPNCMDKRKTGFGYGTKLDFTKQNTVTPAPNTYSIKSIFEDKQKSQGISFGYGREVLYIFGCLYWFQELWQNGILPKKTLGPGPCNYKMPEQLSKISYTIGTRTPINSKIQTKLNLFLKQDKLTFLSAPGPGAYNAVTTLNSTGQYFLSKYPGSKAALINPPRSQRFTNFAANKDNPGPCHYIPKTHLQLGGQYVVSRFHSSLGKSFPKADRSQVRLPSYESLQIVSQLQAFFFQDPGPGSYRLPSDFGYYETKEVKRQEFGLNTQKDESQQKE